MGSSVCARARTALNLQRSWRKLYKAWQNLLKKKNLQLHLILHHMQLQIPPHQPPIKLHKEVQERGWLCRHHHQSSQRKRRMICRHHVRSVSSQVSVVNTIELEYYIMITLFFIRIVFFVLRLNILNFSHKVRLKYSDCTIATVKQFCTHCPSFMSSTVTANNIWPFWLKKMHLSSLYFLF